MQLRPVIRSIMNRQIPQAGYFPESLLDAAAAVSSFRGKFSRLTSVERILTTLRHKEPDRVPVTPLANAVGRRIKGIPFPEYSTVAEKTADALSASIEFVGGDLLVLLIDLSVEAADFGQETIYPEQSTAHPNYLNPVIRHVDDYLNIKPIDFSKASRMNEIVKLCRLMNQRIGSRIPVSGFLFGPLEILLMMRGAKDFYKDCRNYPGHVKKACEAITETLLEFAQAQCDTGVLGITIDTLLASWNALPKDVWTALEGDFTGEIARCVRRNGQVVGIHNCGHALYFDAQIDAMAPDFISFAELPDDCKTPAEMKERYGDRVTFVGFVRTQTLVNGTPQQVMDECKQQIEVLARDGGYILAPGCEYPPNLSLENAFALVKAAELYS
ncbi:MAG: uroporphyrinogen decarboxylase family protein [Thermodesulfobacteriota bacterium]|nr:uroporphyrinogen decarboxylase family protein [Thermodesulfobacteriota bacterium]